jgi:hypothetical protein
VITYKAELPFKADSLYKSESLNVTSVLERLLKIANKNILPTSIMILGLVSGEINGDYVHYFSKSLLERINNLQADLTNYVDTVME